MGLFGFEFAKGSLICYVLLSLYGSALSVQLPRLQSCSVLHGPAVADDLECKPRPQVVSIPRRVLHDVFTPTAVEVNRCSGGCSNMRYCNAVATEKKCVQVEDKIILAYEFREVEEHTECSCCDLTVDMCNDKQILHAVECACKCANHAVEEECLSNRGHWDSINCECM